ncbi:hypothetical protein GQ53DRAFT_838246 [Thozetella sp. PMI_491]|nr:hypothetical protein GQ53DRAFT_838246 [Thozetella sp. PMI_491]
MDANNSTSSSSSGADAFNDSITKLTFVSLVISLVTFAFSTLQGIVAYLKVDDVEVRRSSEEVMGEGWATKSMKVFRYRGLRYQVSFEVPVFYTAPPGITVGPLTSSKQAAAPKGRAHRLLPAPIAEPRHIRAVDPEATTLEVINLQQHIAPIYKITGTPSSYQQTLLSPEVGVWEYDLTQDKGCSWLLLLYAMQEQEKMSRAWDRGPNNMAWDHTICYFIQRQRRCWDFMPSGVTKPFATTTICHLIEIISMLGLVWTEFDVKAPKLAAEGNGYMLTSEYVSGLGIMAKFSLVSKRHHEDRRIIPCIELKRLCFGDVPSLFDSLGQRLQVSPEELGPCLQYLLPELAHEHHEAFLAGETKAAPFRLSPTFQLIAMVAKSFHIPGSRFRRLPNPCGDAPPQDLRVACLDMLAAIIRSQSRLGTDILTQQIKNAFEHGRLDGAAALDPAEGHTLEQLIQEYKTVNINSENEKRSRFYGGEKSEYDAELRHGDALLHLLDGLHNTIRGLDEILNESSTGETMRTVITLHFRTIFRKHDELWATVAQGVGTKEERLVRFYFDSVWPDVVGRTTGDSEIITEDPGVSRSAESSTFDVQKSRVWLALMFRMWSWLFVHDFDSLDRMIERSKYQNSRLPVYIT